MATIPLTVNRKEMDVTLPPEMTLLRFLRDELRLTGPKNGCGTNHCGACMVLVNGKATKSCLLKVGRLHDAEIVTIEGLSEPGLLHPIQAAFLAAGAVQCGFCTPGMIIATKALLDAKPSPTEAEIREGLKGNICRCTGYVKIIDAVKLAARWSKHPEEMEITLVGSYGESVIELDGVAKVQGSLRFADDLYLSGMLHAKVLWSAHPHALIKSLDTTTAEDVPGVVRILTAASTIAFIQTLSQFGLLFLVPLFLINIQGYKAVQTGLILSSLPITMAIAAPLAGRLADRYGCRLLCLSGMAILAVAGMALSVLGPATPSWYTVACLSLAGVAMGMVQAPAPAAISLAVQPDRLGIAMGLFNLLRFLGGTLGPVVFALVLLASGTASAPAAFRADFSLVTIAATIAVMVGIFVPATEPPRSCLDEE